MDVGEQSEEAGPVGNASGSDGVNGVGCRQGVFEAFGDGGRAGELSGSVSGRRRFGPVVHFGIVLSAMDGGRRRLGGLGYGSCFLADLDGFPLSRCLGGEHARGKAELCGGEGVGETELGKGGLRTGRDDLERTTSGQCSADAKMDRKAGKGWGMVGALRQCDGAGLEDLQECIHP